jgi:siroheme synthase
VTSALAAPAALGIPTTLRGVSSSIAITTAQGAGRLTELAQVADTLVVLMARANLDATARELASVVGPSRPAAIVSNATLANERHVAGTLGDIAMLADRERIDAPATLIVGDVVRAMPAARSAEAARAL